MHHQSGRGRRVEFASSISVFGRACQAPSRIGAFAARARPTIFVPSTGRRRSDRRRRQTQRRGHMQERFCSSMTGTGHCAEAKPLPSVCSNGIDQQRYRWVVLTNHLEFAAGCRSRGIPTRVQDFRVFFLGGFRSRDLVDLVRFSATGARIIRQWNISLVHLSNGGSCSWMIPAAWLCRSPDTGAFARPLVAQDALRLRTTFRR